MRFSKALNAVYRLMLMSNKLSSLLRIVHNVPLLLLESGVDTDTGEVA